MLGLTKKGFTHEMSCLGLNSITMLFMGKKDNDIDFFFPQNSLMNWYQSWIIYLMFLELSFCAASVYLFWLFKMAFSLQQYSDHISRYCSVYDISLHPGYLELSFVISIFNNFSLLLTSLLFFASSFPISLHSSQFAMPQVHLPKK